MIAGVQTLYYLSEIMVEHIRGILNGKIMSKDEELSDKVNFTARTRFDKELGIVFWPPVYTQRYGTVCDILNDQRWQGKISKVVDFGCSELSMIRYLKNVNGLETIICVDMDIGVLRSCKHRAQPIINDYIMERQTPLEVKVLQGSAADPDFRLVGSDAVICIELIEHMDPQDLERLIHTVFGFVQPQLAVFTTPNADFNVLFNPLKPNGFRHDDHRFEWTREQFHDWSTNIVHRYPNYEVHCQGVGPGPPTTSHLGCCSQLALFINRAYKKTNSLNIKDLDQYLARTSFKDFMTKEDIDLSPEDIIVRDFYESILEIVIDSRSNTISTRQNVDCDPELVSSDLSKFALLAYDNFNNFIMPYNRGKDFLMQVTHSLNICPSHRTNDRLEITNSKLGLTSFDSIISRNITNVATDLKWDDRITVKQPKKIKHIEDDAKRHPHLWYNINWAEDAPDWFDYYTFVSECHFPFAVDNRSLEQKIVDEVYYKLQTFVSYGEMFYNCELSRWEIPLNSFMPYLQTLTDDVGFLRDCLRDKDYHIENDLLIHIEECRSDEESIGESHYDDPLDEQLHPSDSSFFFNRIDLDNAWDIENAWDQQLTEQSETDNTNILPDSGKSLLQQEEEIIEESANSLNTCSRWQLDSPLLDNIPVELSSEEIAIHRESSEKKADVVERDEKLPGSPKILQSTWSDEAKLYDSGYQKSQDSPLSPLLSGTFSSGLLTPDKDGISEQPGLECIFENLNCAEKRTFTSIINHYRIDDEMDSIDADLGLSAVGLLSPASSKSDEIIPHLRPLDLNFGEPLRPMSPGLDRIEAHSPLSPVERPLLPLRNIRLNEQNGDMLNNNQDYEGNLLVEEAGPPNQDPADIERDIIEGNV